MGEALTMMHDVLQCKSIHSAMVESVPMCKSERDTRRTGVVNYHHFACQ